MTLAGIADVRIADHRGGGGHRRWIHRCVGLALVLTATGAFAASPAQATTGLANGSFEQPTVRAGTFQTFPVGQAIGAWNVSGGSVDLIGNGFWQAADRHQSVDLSGNVAGAVRQTFTTRPGVRYEVIYALAGNPDGAPSVKTGQVIINGSLAQNFTFNTAGHTRQNMGYVTRAVAFRATGVSTTLQFSSTTAGAYGPVLDDVSVEKCGCLSANPA
jgi:choice-of-anchor C domain-containing protein